MQIVACAGPQAFATCAATVVGLTLAAGGSIKQALLAGLMTFAQMGVYDFVGGIVRGVASTAGAFAGAVTKLATHAVVGGAFAVAQGGEFASGAMAGAVSAGASVITDVSGVFGKSGDGNFGGMVGRTAIAAAAGGTASVLAGGKFANGAVTGAMGHLFNAENLFARGLEGTQSGINEVGRAKPEAIGDPMHDFASGLNPFSGCGDLTCAASATLLALPMGRAAQLSIWTAGPIGSPVKNAFKHWSDHGADFPGLQNAKQYVEAAWDFLHNPSAGTLTKVRSNGDVLRYHPSSNSFGVMTSAGVPKTFYKPARGLKYWNEQ